MSTDVTTKANADDKRRGNCVVQKISYPSHRGVFGLTPPPLHNSENSSFGSYFPLKSLAFETPSPLEFLVTLLGVGVAIFWNHTLKKPSVSLCIQFLLTGNTYILTIDPSVPESEWL